MNLPLCKNTSASDEALAYPLLDASLNAIPARDRDLCKQVFRVFALVPEDTFVPINVFQILLSAITDQVELVPELQLRKHIQILISRSVCLGTWERPQLHDIVSSACVMFTHDFCLK